jgi:hypothetical protein
MDTLSSSKVSQWTAKVLIFSGRVDPEWPLPDSIVDKFISLWKSAPHTTVRASSYSKLGYCGCIVCDGCSNEWRIYNGLVSHISSGTDEARSDKNREMEEVILQSAPSGSIPHGVTIPTRAL